MKTQLLSLFFALILWAPSAFAITPEWEVEFMRAVESIISNLETDAQYHKNASVINYREQILNPNLREAREFIQGLWLPESDMLTLMQYSIMSNEKPIEGLNWIPRAEVFRQLEEMRRQASPLCFLEAMYTLPIRPPSQHSHHPNRHHTMDILPAPPIPSPHRSS